MSGLLWGVIVFIVLSYIGIILMAKKLIDDIIETIVWKGKKPTGYDTREIMAEEMNKEVKD